MTDILVWQLRSASEDLRPTVSNYAAAIRTSNLKHGLQMLAHMSDTHSTLLKEGEPRLLDEPTSTPGTQSSSLSSRARKGHHTKVLQPDARCILPIVEKALESKDVDRMGKALSVAQEFGYLPMRGKQEGDKEEDTKDLKAVMEKSWAKIRNDASVSRERKDELREAFN